MRWDINIGLEVFWKSRCTWNCCAFYMKNDSGASESTIPCCSLYFLYQWEVHKGVNRLTRSKVNWWRFEQASFLSWLPCGPVGKFSLDVLKSGWKLLDWMWCVLSSEAPAANHAMSLARNEFLNCMKMPGSLGKTPSHRRRLYSPIGLNLSFSHNRVGLSPDREWR